jgi:phage-related protein
MSWSFGLVNNRLAEIYFEKNKGKVKFMGHAFVKKSEYTTKREKEWIVKDTARIRLTYRNGVYKNN